jgi:T5SS/PEP-CTERM-associated repeat protein
VTSARAIGDTAVLEGTATVTGVGAGEDVPFQLTVGRGGPGTRVVLEVSGLTFREIVLEGQISF